MASSAPQSALSSQPATSPPPGVRFVARQPILTAEEKVFGYELLFRDGVQNCFRHSDPDAAARSTLDSSLLLGLDVLCHGRYAFINCHRDLLLNDYVTLLPAKQTVLEILETVELDSTILAACKNLREAGYLIALDDFVGNDPREALVDMADLIKVDLLGTTREQCADLVKRLGPRHRMVAEKVETREQFQWTREMGFAYFQGFFFREPEVLTTHDIPANRLNYVLMLQVVSQPELNLRKIEDLIKGEVSICYRLLRYLNSAAFGFTHEIHSVRHALGLLGEREIRRWVRLVATLGAGQYACSEVLFSALARARFCELLGPKLPHGGSDLFLLGLMSMMDVILNSRMEDVLEKVPLEPQIKDALLSRPSPLRDIYRLMLAQESGEWQGVSELATHFRLTTHEIADAHWQGMQWAREVGRS